MKQKEALKKEIITMPSAFVQIHIIVADNGPVSLWWPNLTFFNFDVNKPFFLCCLGQNFQEELNLSKSSKNINEKKEYQMHCYPRKWSIHI